MLLFLFIETHVRTQNNRTTISKHSYICCKGQKAKQRKFAAVALSRFHFSFACNIAYICALHSCTCFAVPLPHFMLFCPIFAQTLATFVACGFSSVFSRFSLQGMHLYILCRFVRSLRLYFRLCRQFASTLHPTPYRRGPKLKP